MANPTELDDARRKRIGRRIANVRHLLNKERAEIAAAAHIGVSSLAAYEQGTRENPRTLTRIAEALGMTYEELLDPGANDVAFYMSSLQAIVEELSPEGRSMLLRHAKMLERDRA